MKERQAAERRALFGSLKGKGYDRRYIGAQRAALATKHAYEAVLLKEEQKKRRGEYQKQNPTYPTYEQWLRDQGLSSEADGWRHRKNKGFFQIEPPEGAEQRKPEPAEPVGLPGFRMEISRQGARFYSGQSAEASFIDSGRVIRVYRKDDESLLAALQLGQEKWGGVKVTGSDEYKRRSVELAAEHGIRIVNSELQGVMRELVERKRKNEKIAERIAAAEDTAKTIEEIKRVASRSTMEKVYITSQSDFNQNIRAVEKAFDGHEAFESQEDLESYSTGIKKSLDEARRLAEEMGKAAREARRLADGLAGRPTPPPCVAESEEAAGIAIERVAKQEERFKSECKRAVRRLEIHLEIEKNKQPVPEADIEVHGVGADRRERDERQEETTAQSAEPEQAEGQTEDGEDIAPSVPRRVTYAELEERRDELAAKLETEAQKIARPKIAEAERRQIEAEAKRIKGENASIYKKYCSAFDDYAAHVKKEPPKPLFFGRGDWEREHRAWKDQNDAKQRRTEELWEKAGGDMSLKHTGYGKAEVDRRLSDEYALEEAKKRYDKSDEWKAVLKNVNNEALREAGRRDPKTWKAFGDVNRELEEREPERKLNRRIAELDGKLKKHVYALGSAGFSLLVEYASEVIQLEQERGNIDEREAGRLHPAAVAILEKDAEYRQRDRGLGR
jgi:hypothetical protein